MTAVAMTNREASDDHVMATLLAITEPEDIGDFGLHRPFDRALVVELGSDNLDEVRGEFDTVAIRLRSLSGATIERVTRLLRAGGELILVLADPGSGSAAFDADVASTAEASWVGFTWRMLDTSHRAPMVVLRRDPTPPPDSAQSIQTCLATLCAAYRHGDAREARDLQTALQRLEAAQKELADMWTRRRRSELALLDHVEALVAAFSAERRAHRELRESIRRGPIIRRIGRKVVPRRIVRTIRAMRGRKASR